MQGVSLMEGAYGKELGRKTTVDFCPSLPPLQPLFSRLARVFRPLPFSRFSTPFPANSIRISLLNQRIACCVLNDGGGKEASQRKSELASV